MTDPLQRLDTGSGGRTGLFVLLLGSGMFVGARAWLVDAPPIEMSLLSTFSSFGYASVGCVRFTQTDHVGRRRWTGLTLALLAISALGLAWADAATALNLAKAGLIAMGLAGVVEFLRDAWTAHAGAEKQRRMDDLRTVLIAPLATAQVTYFLWPHTLLNPVYDLYIHDVERTLGILFEPTIQGLYHALDPWTVPVTICYLALPVGLSLLAWHQPSLSLRTRVLAAAALTGAIGFLLYQICPAVGPFQSAERVFGAALIDLADVVPRPLDAPGRVPRNGMPSLHAVWAFLIILNARLLPPVWRRLAIVFAVLNLTASLGRYQHWLLDHVIALPMTGAIQLVVVNQPFRVPRHRWILAASCAAVTMAWLLGFRYGLLTGMPGWLGWLALGVTMALPIVAAAPWPLEPEGPTRHRDTAAESG